MAMIVSHISALEYWLHNPNPAFLNEDSFRGFAGKTDVLLDAPPASLCTVGLSSNTVFSWDASDWPVVKARQLGLSLPLHVSVPDVAQRQRRNDVVFHVVPTIFDVSSLVRVTKSVFVVSPEVCLAQVAGMFDELDLMLLVSELCGFYSTCADTDMLFPPLTSLRRIASMMGRLPVCDGKKMLARSCRYAVQRSCSVRETQSALTMSLPKGHYGYGLRDCVLNGSVKLSKRALRMASPYEVLPDRLHCDLLWPDAGVGVEYDSKSHHGDDVAIARDLRRRELMGYSGVQVHPLRNATLTDKPNMDAFARRVAFSMGKRIRPTTPDYAQGQMELRHRLLFEPLRYVTLMQELRQRDSR